MVGVAFTGISTWDFVMHLDRQMHGAHCSFIPGLGLNTDGVTACEIAMMSPYSSVLRGWIWGGLPITLPGLGLFGFLLAKGVSLLSADHDEQRETAAFLLPASVLPVLASVVMATLAAFQLNAFCKPCVGIYVTSFVCFVTAIAAFLAAEVPERDPDSEDMVGLRWLLMNLAWTVALMVFVAMPCVLYLGLAPDFSSYVGACGELESPDDNYEVMLPLSPREGGILTVELFDPLCPACRALEDRLSKLSMADQLDRRLVLFPLDSTCNWMVGETINPGSCVVTEGVLCADDRAPEVIAWAFENQEMLKDLAVSDGPDAVGAKMKQQYPALSSCMGTPEVQTRLNRSLRWAVQNSLRVLTPQVFVDGVAVCEEDTDLGLQFILSRILDAHAAGTLHSEAAP